MNLKHFQSPKMLKIKILTVAVILPIILATNLSRPRFYPLNSDNRIVGGLPVSIEQTPYQISLQDRNFHICGGSIIAPSYVLTAAHCTDGNVAINLKIRAGSDYYKLGGVIIQVKAIHQHEQFDSDLLDFDFSILELVSNLKFSQSVQPVNLPSPNEVTLDDTLCTVSGWGNTQNSFQSGMKLRAAYVPIVKQSTCDEAYIKFGGLTERMICAGYMQGHIDSCQGLLCKQKFDFNWSFSYDLITGDSGGPLVARNKLVGVVSWGYGCAKAGFPGVYSKVSSVRNWIATISRV